MATDIFIYSEAYMNDARGALEDDLEVLLGNVGEVTGGGLGASGWNIDLVIHDDDLADDWIPKIVTFLRQWGVPCETYLQIVPPD